MSKIGKMIPKPIKMGLLWLARRPEKIKVWVYQAAATGKIPFPDKLFQKWDYRIHTGRKLNIKNPILYPEKLQWLKYYYHNPLYTTLVDKYAVRDWIKEKIGEECLVPIYGVYDTFDEIDFSTLPNQFVMKCTHDSGSVIICKNKNELEIEKARSTIETALSINHFYRSREWPYKNVKPRIIIEKYMFNEDGSDANDYKFFCFDGKVKIFQVNCERQSETGTKTNFYLPPWEQVDIRDAGYAPSSYELKKPEKLEEMICLAEQIAQYTLPHARIDFNLFNNRIYFGEITFYHCGGRKFFEPFSANEMFSEWLILPAKMRNG